MRAEMTKGFGHSPRRAGQLRFRPGEMPALYGDTAAALIVDDDEPTGRVLSTLLSREGYRCTVTTGAVEARAHVADTQFAVALIDVMMPGETGLEFAHALLDMQSDVAVVMVTGVDDPRIAEVALEAGAYGYIVKPFRLNQVSIAVAMAGRLRCLEIERRLYRSRLEQLVGEQAVDLAEIHARLGDPADSSPNSTPS